MAVFIELHLFDLDFLSAFNFRDGRKPFYGNAFLQCFFNFEVMSGHLVSRTAVNNERFSTKSLGRTSDVNGSIAAAVNYNFAAEKRFSFTFHASQDGDSVQHMFGISAGDVSTFGEVSAYTEENGIVGVVLHFVI